MTSLRNPPDTAPQLGSEERTGAHESRDGPKAGIRSAPAYLTADVDELIRPDTLLRLRALLATPAVDACTFSLNRDEARTILEMVDTRWVVARAWTRTLEWGIRYAGMARSMAERSGFADYVGWMERRRIQPMQQLHTALTTHSAIAEDQLAEPS